MSRFAQRGLVLREQLEAVAVRWACLRGLLLVDGEGLPLASTFRSRALEERVAALATLGIDLSRRARSDLDLGQVQVLHLAGLGRQLFIVPLEEHAHLVAVADPDASQMDLQRQLLATALSLLAVTGDECTALT